MKKKAIEKAIKTAIKYDGSHLDLSVDERVGSDVLSLIRSTWV